MRGNPLEFDTKLSFLDCAARRVRSCEREMRRRRAASLGMTNMGAIVAEDWVGLTLLHSQEWLCYLRRSRAMIILCTSLVPS